MKKIIVLLIAVFNLLNVNAQCWTKISPGAQHSLAIKSDGTLWGWGANYSGQLGDGTNINKNIPVQIGSANNWAIIAAGGYHSLTIKTSFTTKCLQKLCSPQTTLYLMFYAIQFLIMN